MCIIWGISTLYMHLCSLSPIYRARVLKEKAFRVYLKKSINLSCLSVEISLCLALFIHISSHGVAAKPGTWVAANVTGRFTARTFHSRKLAGVFGRKKEVVYV